MSAPRLPVRLIFPEEAIECVAFRALYEQLLPFGDEEIDRNLGEITFLHPSAPAGRLDSLERLLVSAGLPYNLYSETASGLELLHCWRPGMLACVCLETSSVAAPVDPPFILSVRRACQELVYGQATLGFDRELEICA